MTTIGKARHDHHRDARRGWLFLLAALSLAGCSGTQGTFSGMVCGQRVDFTFTDRRDREGGTTVVADCGEGKGSITITTGPSATSSVATVDAETAGAMIGAAIKAGVLP